MKLVFAFGLLALDAVRQVIGREVAVEPNRCDAVHGPEPRPSRDFGFTGFFP